MLILLTSDEDKKLAIEGLKELLNKPDMLENLNKDIFIDTGLVYSDLLYYLDKYVLEEGRQNGKRVSKLSY